jgi:KaiC/GvpD/RAD55 family RecA-like ATPase
MASESAQFTLNEWHSPDAPPPIVAVPVDPRVPSGIADFDSLSGGIPVGSVVLLLGEAGAGHHEFAITSATHLMLHRDDDRMHKFYLGGARGSFVYPKGISYVSLTRSRDQVLDEIRSAFNPEYGAVLDRHLTFTDLSPEYFADSVVPANWASTPAPLLSAAAAPRYEAGGGPLVALARALEECGPSNVVLLDSLTDLLVRTGIRTEDLVTLVKGLRRRAKSWGGVVYLLLTKGVGSPDTEQALIDSVDGVLAFSWTANPIRSSRQRVMVIPKFMSVLAHVPHEHQGRFVIRINALSGLVTTQYERI